jgi:hypothetical protein
LLRERRGDRKNTEGDKGGLKFDRHGWAQGFKVAEPFLSRAPATGAFHIQNREYARVTKNLDSQNLVSESLISEIWASIWAKRPVDGSIRHPSSSLQRARQSKRMWHLHVRLRSILRSQISRESAKQLTSINPLRPMKRSPSLRRCQHSPAFVALLVAASIATAQSPAKLDPPVKPTVSGKFTGNGKNAAIKFVTVEEHEPFSGKDAITLIFTEKDPAKAKKPSFDAMFGRLGSALILNVFHDGGIFGCQVAHSAHEKQGFSSIGEIKMVDFKIAGGNVNGHVSTGKELDTFGQKWDVDLTFAAPLPAKLRNAPAAATPTKPTASQPSEPGEPAKKESKQPARPLVAARKLPLPKDATNVEFKATVKQIQFSSARPVEIVAKEFSASLNQQGWKESTGSLMGKTECDPPARAGRCEADDHGSTGSGGQCGEDLHRGPGLERCRRFNTSLIQESRHRRPQR